MMHSRIYPPPPPNHSSRNRRLGICGLNGEAPTALPWLQPPLTPSIYRGKPPSWSFVPQEFIHQVITTVSASPWVLPGNYTNCFSARKVHFKYYPTQWTENREALSQQLKEQVSEHHCPHLLSGDDILPSYHTSVLQGSKTGYLKIFYK